MTKNAQRVGTRNTGVGKHIPIHFFFLKKRDAFTYRRENECHLQNELLQPGGTPVFQVSLAQGTKQRSAVRLSLQPRLLPPRTPVPELRDTHIPSHLEAFKAPFLLPRTPHTPAPGLSLQHSGNQLRGTSHPREPAGRLVNTDSTGSHPTSLFSNSLLFF